MQIEPHLIEFLQKQKVLIVSSFDQAGNIHCSAKGIVGLDKKGKIYIIDLYQNQTYQNLKANPNASLTTLNEKDFKGYTFQGKAKIVPREQIADCIIKEWESRIIERIMERVVTNVRSDKKGSQHFEAKLPTQPQYLIEIEVEKIINLAPPQFT